MKTIHVLGPGCPKCEKLVDMVEEATKELGGEFEVRKVTDIGEITSFGVMMTPALVVDGAVKLSGKLPTLEELKSMLT